MPDVLVDYHHADLFESLQLTLGDRLGFEVYAPFGMDWYDRWYWSFEREWHGDAVARQYLTGIWRGMTPNTDGIVRLPDPRHPGRTLTGITLDAALSRSWDLVISSVPTNAPGFAKLAGETGARFGIHIGNQWGDEAWAKRPSFAIVTATCPVPPGVSHAVVHQEFRLADFRYEEPAEFGPVRSFVNCFPESDEYAESFLPLARSQPDFRWEVFGAYGRIATDEFAAGDLGTTPGVAAAMRGAGVIWHAKHWSDGFGHVVHNAFAVGRPVIGYARYYADKLAGPLWVDGVTSFDVESHGKAETLEFMRSLRSDPDRYRAMCEAAARRFREVVDFDADAEKVAQMLGVLHFPYHDEETATDRVYSEIVA